MSEKEFSKDKPSCFGSFIPVNQSSSSEASGDEIETGMCDFYVILIH